MPVKKANRDEPNEFYPNKHKSAEPDNPGSVAFSRPKQVAKLPRCVAPQNASGPDETDITWRNIKYPKNLFYIIFAKYMI
jgi:hypothetical protein